MIIHLNTPDKRARYKGRQAAIDNINISACPYPDNSGNARVWCAFYYIQRAGLISEDTTN